MSDKEISRCAWVTSDPLYEKYHDEEWGVPVHDDKRHYEFLVLETSQAGLSWLTLLRKREGYRKAFSDFNYNKVAMYTDSDINGLVNNAGIIRNRRKIEAAIHNARCFIDIQKEFGSFDAYCWAFVDGRPKKNIFTSGTQVPVTTVESDNFSKDLKKRGFKFIGSIVMYAHMQAVGMINDHLTTCFRYNQV